MTHEFSLMADLMRKIEDTVRQDGGHGRIVGVTVKLGALAHISAAHFRDHFQHAARGSVAAGAQLHIIESADATDPHAQDIMLESVEVSS
jgi:hydrogenase nickel incorporation protein HypA/HybF